MSGGFEQPRLFSSGCFQGTVRSTSRLFVCQSVLFHVDMGIMVQVQACLKDFETSGFIRRGPERWYSPVGVSLRNAQVC